MRALTLVVLVAACGAGAHPASQPAAAPPLRVQKVMIPMRDGVRLETVLFLPTDRPGPFPFLLSRTPYGVHEKLPSKIPPPAAALMADGYIWVFQSVRGRFGSEGEFVMVRPPRDRADPRAVDESTDAYDTIAWLLANVPGNNGRVGMWGISYDAWTAAMALLDPHPALRAVAEQASPDDMFANDDFHHNGAFRLAYGFEYVAFVETSAKDNTHFAYDRRDLYDWFLDLGPLANANARHFHGKVPTWNDFVAHPNRDAFWERRALATHLARTTVPTLNVAGWWDQEDFVGPQDIYALLERDDAAGRNFLLVGPWKHGGWWGEARKLGPIEFGRDTGADFAALQARWFAYWLHGRGQLDFPEAQVFETGSNVWRRYDRWPPREARARRLYLRAGGALSFEPPVGDGFDAYVSDPRNPVPYRPRPIPPLFGRGTAWSEWLVQDQRFVDHRPDVLSYQTAPLAEPLVIAGDILVELHASTSGTDADWIVKLIDVQPDLDANLPGYQLIIADEVLRARFRDGLATPRPVPADQVVAYRIDLHGNAHAFQKDHRIMVQIQSTWFPLIDRNPQRWVENIFDATEADFVPATQHVHRSARAPSAIVLPVVAP